MNGEHEMSEFFKAAFFQYEGATCIRCSTTGRETTWFFRVPQFDAEIIEEHFADDEMPILLKPFVAAQKAVDSFRVQARKNFGEWIGPKYAQVAA